MATVDLVKNWLSTEGYRYDVDSDGDVHFKYEGINYYFTVDNNDQSFFRIIMPAIYKVEGNRARVLEAANTITRDIKVLSRCSLMHLLRLRISSHVVCQSCRGEGR